MAPSSRPFLYRSPPFSPSPPPLTSIPPSTPSPSPSSPLLNSLQKNKSKSTVFPNPFQCPLVARCKSKRDEMRQQHWLWLLYFVFVAIYANLRADGDGVSPQEAKQLRDEVRGMFYHAFNGYMKHGFPLAELSPLSCKGQDSLGGKPIYALTLIDDTLALLG